MDQLRPFPRHRRPRWLPDRQRPRCPGRLSGLRVHARLQQQPAEFPGGDPSPGRGRVYRPRPHFANLSGQDVYNGNQSKDVSEVITRTLAPNTAGDPLAGHINTAVGVGVSGNSMGGMTTHGLLTAWPDARITAAIPMSCVDMGNPSLSVRAAPATANYFRDSRTINTFVDRTRWSLYGDTGARDRLRADATSSTTTWESVLS